MDIYPWLWINSQLFEETLPEQIQIWEKWNFAQLSDAVRQWARRNPVDPNRENTQTQGSTKLLYPTHRECVYCVDVNHKASTCNKMIKVADRKQILKKKRLCVNCAIGSYRAADCSSKSTYQHCGRRHHSSICDLQKRRDERENALTTNHSSEGAFPVLVIEVNGVKCRALIDFGSTSSYISANLVNILKAKAVSSQTEKVEMLMSSKRVRMKIYNLNTESVDGSFQMPVKFIKVERSELLTIKNLHWKSKLKTRTRVDSC